MSQELEVQLSDELIELLIARALENGRSPEEEHRAILMGALRLDVERIRPAASDD
jgi:plasmid stability protein